MADYYIGPELERELQHFISEKWATKKVKMYWKKGRWQSRCWLKIPTVLPNSYIHYEYSVGYGANRDWEGTLCLHFEGQYAKSDYASIWNYVRKESNLEYQTEGNWRRMFVLASHIKSLNELKKALSENIARFDAILDKCKEQYDLDTTDVTSEEYKSVLSFKELEGSAAPVCLLKLSLSEVFNANLVIPDYQRAYCWEDKHVVALWNNLKEIPKGFPYHLGTLILQRKKENGKELYNIIDGQQRLVTLTLILRELRYKGQMPLLKQSFQSDEAVQHIGNNKAVILELVNKCTNKRDLLEVLSNNINFSVLVVNDSNLDLAYTFFSNQNSKGVPLTDYDLLKAHHLRYINFEAQAEHLAKQWDRLTMESADRSDQPLEQTLGYHLFRLRKWMRKKDFDETAKYRVKEEYVAAPIMMSIPAFGEQFYYYEKIQGGAHFFAYTQKFVEQYKIFLTLPQVSRLRDMDEEHKRYASVIETLLFGYYLKFGSQYLSEALFCIAGIMAQHRYQTGRAFTYKILEYAKDSEIIMMIDQASSPTFFFAEALPYIKISGESVEGGVRLRFYDGLRNLFSALNDFTDNTIIERKNHEYN